MEDNEKEDAKKPSSCAIRISLKEHKLNIHKSTIAMLGRPGYVQLLINKKSNVIFIKGCDKKERDTFAVPEGLFLKPKADFTLHSKVFTDAIAAHSGWEKDSAYRMEGIYLPEIEVVSFRLKEGKRLSS